MAELRERFWERYALDELTQQEWEALCDGCGQCCLRKLEDEDTGDLAVLGLSCRLLDTHSCRCSDYDNRLAKVPDCTQLTPELAHQFKWLPHSCAYRRLAEGRRLAGWHHLICGDPERVHRKGISVRSFAISETEVDEADLEDLIIAVIPVEG